MNKRESIDQIVALVTHYAEAVYNGDAEKLKETFHKDARMNGFMGDSLQLGTPESFFEEIANNPAMKDPFKATITHLAVTGNIATVIVYATGFFGEGIVEDHFQLIRDENNEWKIIAKCFTTL
ncbi:nuclear transport factor 2 family protein [Vagococcus acidifermentans]|uniref:DUF4440 domain-containing protein n=1 Tax=Vagococcus acidifermentans TaxID=564710 RepID=A0A430AP56_9ENTE|nr:nuclear transport factor 2 family protein [Vagococcus acidifermentans]RSU09667.1 hypothetical protein CBF27_12325 [Vagococcus acidifermentans]